MVVFSIEKSDRDDNGYSNVIDVNPACIIDRICLIHIGDVSKTGEYIENHQTFGQALKTFIDGGEEIAIYDEVKGCLYRVKRAEFSGDKHTLMIIATRKDATTLGNYENVYVFSFIIDGLTDDGDFVIKKFHPSYESIIVPVIYNYSGIKIDSYKNFVVTYFGELNPVNETNCGNIGSTEDRYMYAVGIDAQTQNPVYNVYEFNVMSKCAGYDMDSHCKFAKYRLSGKWSNGYSKTVSIMSVDSGEILGNYDEKFGGNYDDWKFKNENSDK